MSTNESDSKIRQYLDIDVYTASKQRIKHVIESFDSVLVAFSGGKDSLTVLNLVQECYDELGINEKMKVFFRDEELIPNDVIDFVKGIYLSGKYDFRWYAIPLKSMKFILGNTIEYVQFDKDREWVRQPPEFAIRLKDEEYTVFSQYDADSFICKNEYGRVAILTGIRADESLVRLRATINKRNENYINATGVKRIKLVKPIYDWTEKDVFTYFHHNNIKYCPIYDSQFFNGEQMRVSTPLHPESAKKFNYIKTRDPEFYDRLIKVFPEMIVQGMYYKSLDSSNKFESGGYEHTIDGVLQYANDVISDKNQRELAVKRLNSAWNIRQNTLNRGEGADNLGGYPLRYLVRCVDTGNFKRVILSKGTCTREDFAFEGIIKSAGVK